MGVKCCHHLLLLRAFHPKPTVRPVLPTAVFPQSARRMVRQALNFVVPYWLLLPPRYPTADSQLLLQLLHMCVTRAPCAVRIRAHSPLPPRAITGRGQQ